MWVAVAWLLLLADSAFARSTSSYTSGVVTTKMPLLAISKEIDHLSPRRAVQNVIETITETVPVTVCTCDMKTSTPSTTAITSSTISITSQVMTSTTESSASLSSTSETEMWTATTTLIGESTVTETSTSTSIIGGSTTTQMSTVTMKSISKTISTTILTLARTISTTTTVLAATTTSTTATTSSRPTTTEVSTESTAIGSTTTEVMTTTTTSIVTTPITSISYSTTITTTTSTAPSVSTATTSFPESTTTEMSTAATTIRGSTATKTSTIVTTLDGTTVIVGGTTVSVPGTTKSKPIVITETVSEPLTTIPASTITKFITQPLGTVTLSSGTTILPASTVTATISYPATGPDSTATEITTGPETTQTQSSSGITTDSLSVCPTLITNPTYTPASPLPTNHTWGCPPGYLCKPPHTGDRVNCNIEAGLPAANYVCNPSECSVSPPLVWEQGGDAVDNHYSVSDEYYNLDPEDFGLSYSIFEDSRESNTANSKRDMITLVGNGRSLLNIFASRRIKRDTSDIPGVCYNDCNDAALEPQEIGKIPELCERNSAFMVELGNCKTCISTYASSASSAWSQKLLPSFAQFLDYCSDSTNSTSFATKTATPSTTTSAGATETSLLFIGGSSDTSIEASTAAAARISIPSMSIQVSGEAATTSFNASAGTVTKNGENSHTAETTDAATTGSTQPGETTSSAWTTRAAALRTAPETGSMGLKFGAESTGAQAKDTSTEKPRTTGDVSSNARVQTDTVSASASASAFDTPLFAAASAYDVPRIDLLGCLLAVSLSLL